VLVPPPIDERTFFVIETLVPLVHTPPPFHKDAVVHFILEYGEAQILRWRVTDTDDGHYHSAKASTNTHSDLVDH